MAAHFDALAKSASKEPQRTEPSVETFLAQFTAEPHPIGSKAQKTYAQSLVGQLRGWGWKADVETFKAEAPNLETIPEKRSPEFLKRVNQDRRPFITQIEGRNVVAVRKGTAPCSVILSGHYDTKHFTAFRFVGANDGGSSTALLLEIARRLGKSEKTPAPKKGTSPRFVDCTLGIVFFDGEEALLPEWEDGERLLGLKDHLYGSTAFSARLSKKGGKYHWQSHPLRLVAVFDMVGHKSQRLSITAGSDEEATRKFLEVAQGIPVERNAFSVEDDHLPFQEKGIPVLHLIDWTNIGEWHTRFDDMSIVSPEKIERLADGVMRFLER